MRDLFRLFGASFAGVSLVAMSAAMAVAQAPRGHAGVAAAQIGRSVMSARMPTMPTGTWNVGTLDLPSATWNPNLPDTPDTPDNPGSPDLPDQPDEPDAPDTPDNPDTPDTPTGGCPDGGVENSEYTVKQCMQDLTRCVNTGGVPGGLNDLFDEQLRNSIVNGMGLCASYVQKCITQVRQDCSNVYRTSADVWIDFNARVIQPEYYSFVLRKTGLTPIQAENTCLLLDRNTYGSSFNAVSPAGITTAEYNNRVGAYNKSHGNVLVKTNPQGVTVNGGGRGHYARWDASKAECWIRVAAYNKDEHIKNSWLFGAAGDDRPAEVWKLAGDTFTCNKELFGFSLMNDTSTAAVVGIGGGTLVGAGVGAIAGHGDRAFDCTNDGQRKKLMEQLRDSGNVATLNEYLEIENRLDVVGNTMTVDQCRDVVNLHNVYNQIDMALDDCENVGAVTVTETVYDQPVTATFLVRDNDGSVPVVRCRDVDACNAILSDANALSNAKQKINVTEDVDIEIIDQDYNQCLFKPINISKRDGLDIYCQAKSGCVGPLDMRKDLNRLGHALDAAQILNGEKSNMLKSVGVGAAIGAGAGGLATAITAFVEKNNINCRVGDGLAQIGMGKAHNIETLKEFYVKWGLRLPDTTSPTASVVDCNTWRSACAKITNMAQCQAAQFNYQPTGAPTITLVHTPCTVSGSVCIENYPVAKSYGACE